MSLSPPEPYPPPPCPCAREGAPENDRRCVGTGRCIRDPACDPRWQQPAVIELNEKRPGIELLFLRGPAGYQTETLHIENGLTNGLRFLMIEDEWDEEGGEVVEGAGAVGHFHITSRSTARLIARTLLEWADRIANPPDMDETT